MKLLCKKSCWYEGEPESEDPFVINGETYGVKEICGDKVVFINALGYSHTWETSDPEFHEYLEILESHLPETSTETLIPYVKPTEKYVMDNDSPYGLLAIEAGKERDTWVTKGSVKSDGGKSSYYHIPFPEWLLKKVTSKGYIEIEDFAEIAYGNDFNYTNVLKAQKRMYELEQGNGKAGNDFKYDANKCHYYVDKQLERFKR